MKDRNVGVCEKFEEKKWRVCRGVVCLALEEEVLGGEGGGLNLSWLVLSCNVLHFLVLPRVVLCCVVLI
jgi:hypothetical protein